MIGENPAFSKAGITTILLKAGEKKGKIKITASSDKLESATIIIFSK